MQDSEVQFFFTGALQVAVFNSMIVAVFEAPFLVSDPLHDLTGGQLLEVFTVTRKVLLVITVGAIWHELGNCLWTSSL